MKKNPQLGANWQELEGGGFANLQKSAGSRAKREGCVKKFSQHAATVQPYFAAGIFASILALANGIPSVPAVFECRS
jgi:hypothetical protein